MFRSLFLRSFPSLALLILIAVLSVAPEFDRAVEAQDTGGARGARSAAPAVRPHHPPPRGYTLIEQEGWAWAIPRGSDPPPEVWTTLIDERLAAMRVHLGRTGSIEPLVVRTPDPSSFRRVTVEFGGGTPEDWVAALAFPARGIVVLDAQRLAFQPYKRREIIAHELAHVVLGEAGPNIPRWYHEGVAQWLAGEQLEQEWTRLLARFASDDSMYRFAELKSFPPESQRESSIFYAQAHLFVLHLNSRFGTPVHPRLLDRLAAGDRFDAAFLTASGVPLAEVEDGWREALAREHSWWSFIAGGLTFFQLVAFFAVIAFLVQRGRRRRVLARMAELEEGESPDPRSYGGVLPEIDPPRGLGPVGSAEEQGRDPGEDR